MDVDKVIRDYLDSEEGESDEMGAEVVEIEDFLADNSWLFLTFTEDGLDFLATPEDEWIQGCRSGVKWGKETDKSGCYFFV